MNYFGATFNLRIDDWIQENIYFTQDYEHAELLFLSNHLKAGDTFVDIGANIGVYSLIASKLLSNKGKVISFEASKKNYLRLQEHIQLNHAININAHHLAIADNEKEITLFYDEQEANIGMISAYGNEDEAGEKIKAVALDNFLKNEKIDFIKIDIEGGEYDALKGMRNILQTQSPTILLEIEEEIIAKTNYTSEDLIQFLKELGYAKNYISDTGDLISENKNPSRKNYIFLKQKLKN
jgi:FkbM family methyltransferase